MKSNKCKLFIGALFIIYLIVLVDVIVLKGGTAAIIAKGLTNKSINIVPFRTILGYLSGQEGFEISATNILGNICAFSPLGFFIPLLFDEHKGLVKTLAISLIISASFEFIQYQFNLGSCDIDDIILNIFGTIIGFIVYKVIKNLIKNSFNDCFL